MNGFNSKREWKIDRYKELEEKHKSLASGRFDEAHLIGVALNGNPIKIGHHSEKMHRRHIERHDTHMRKGNEHLGKADYYKEKAEAAENNTSIYTEDPEAIEKLEMKITEMIKKRDWMKESKRKYKRYLAGNYQPQGMEKDWFDSIAGRVDRCGRPLPLIEPYEISNLTTNIRNTKKRLRRVRNIKSINRESEMINGVEIITSGEENRVRIIFPGIPVRECIDELKKNAFRWSRTLGAWQRNISPRAINKAREIVLKYYGEGATAGNV